MFFSTASALFLALSVAWAVPHRQRGTLPCYQDNPLRALQRSPSEASSFCPKLLASDVAIPSDFTQYGNRMTSACSCYEETASTIAPTTATSATTSPLAPVTPTSPTTSPPETGTASAAVAPTGIKTGGTGKRGLVYNYNSKSAYANFFVGSSYVSFGSNWGGTRVAGNGITIPSSFAFVPTLTVNGNLENDNWDDTAKSAVQSGSKYVFASNEPDNAGQANLSPADTAKVYQKYMQPLKGQALLATPAVTNANDSSTGLNFLGKFLDACTGCHFDMINIHHYVQRSEVNVEQAVATLKSYIETSVPALQAKYPAIQNIPIMVGEFWLWDASLTEGGSYLQEIMPYLDSNPNIIGYQAFGGLWTGSFITSDGSGLTPAGTAYES